MEVLRLTQAPIGYETDTPEGIRACAGFVKGWLEARDIEPKGGKLDGLPVLAATVGAGDVAITGEPTDMDIGVQSKGVLALRIQVSGSSSDRPAPATTGIGGRSSTSSKPLPRRLASRPHLRIA